MPVSTRNASLPPGLVITAASSPSSNPVALAKVRISRILVADALAAAEWLNREFAGFALFDPTGVNLDHRLVAEEGADDDPRQARLYVVGADDDANGHPPTGDLDLDFRFAWNGSEDEERDNDRGAAEDRCGNCPAQEPVVGAA